MYPENPHERHRRSMRLEGYDYSQPGAYFITLVTSQREHLFGQILDGAMQLSILGRMARDEWMRSSQIRHEIRLYEDEIVVMPNHLHGIVWIATDELDNNTSIVGADSIRPYNDPQDANLASGANLAPLLRRMPRSLGTFVSGFKSSVTSRALKEMNISPVWQRNYYDHIIRNQEDFKNIWQYIDDNPRKWQEDRLFS